MIIQSNAVPSEKDSPFYKGNEVFCHEIEEFILNKKGNIKGNYNSYSYLVYGKITTPKEWILEYKKSSFSAGNLLLSSKYQGLLVACKWQTKVKREYHSEFKIRRKKIRDSVFGIFNRCISESKHYPKYVIISKEKSNLVPKLITTLSVLFQSKEIYEITCANNVLKIDLRTEKHYFDIFNELIDLNLN